LVVLVFRFYKALLPRIRDLLEFLDVEFFKRRFVHFRRSFRHTRSPTLIRVPYVPFCRHKLLNPTDTRRPMNYTRSRVDLTRRRVSYTCRRVLSAKPHVRVLLRHPPLIPASRRASGVFIVCLSCFGDVLSSRIGKCPKSRRLVLFIYLFVFLCFFLVFLCSLLCFFRSNLVCKNYFIAQNVCPLLDQADAHFNVETSFVVQVILSQLWSVMM
jgi:hypothetical protein